MPLGSVAGLVAPNGSGKTTLLEGLASPWRKGVSGVCVAKGVQLDEREWRRKVVYVPGPSFLYPNLTGMQQADITRGLWSSAVSVERLVGELDVGGYMNVPIRRCSQGMAQMLSLVVALCTGARYLLLDEPASTLDISNVRRVGEVLRRYAEGGAAVLMSTHNALSCDETCDQVVWLVEGESRVEARGIGERPPCAEVYRQLYGTSDME